jgi:16S rRNA (guanine(527)-N(7))-methyltransferase RsmG
MGKLVLGTKTVRSEFIGSLQKHQALFGLEISDQKIERLADYYDLVIEHNPILHLVAPCTPEEFATRHILESLTLLEFLPESARFSDVGAGAGLPSIPCLLARDDLKVDLIESKIKKSEFLRKAIEELSRSDRANVINKQFEEAESGEASVVTCRALDRFSEKLPRLIKWSKNRPLLLFGGPDLRPLIKKYRLVTAERLMPLSERRFLYFAE